MTISLAGALEKGANKIEIERTGGSTAMNASVVSSYYIPWADSEATKQENLRTGEKRVLRQKSLTIATIFRWMMWSIAACRPSGSDSAATE